MPRGHRVPVLAGVRDRLFAAGGEHRHRAAREHRIRIGQDFGLLYLGVTHERARETAVRHEEHLLCRDVLQRAADVLVGNPLRRIIGRRFRRNPVAAPGLLDELSVTRIEDGDAVVRTAFANQPVKLAHDGRLASVGQRTHFVAELLPVETRDFLDVFRRRIEPRYAAAVAAFADQQRHLAFDSRQMRLRGLACRIAAG